MLRRQMEILVADESGYGTCPSASILSGSLRKQRRAAALTGIQKERGEIQKNNSMHSRVKLLYDDTTCS